MIFRRIAEALSFTTLCAASMGFSACALAQSVPGFTVSTYAEPVIGPVFLAFAPDGTLFAGRDLSPPGGNITPTFITRIGAAGAPIEDYGALTTPDPDPVAFDAQGVVSGVAGSVLTGGNSTSPVRGTISAIRPDQQVVQLWSSTLWTNPSEMRFDAQGRLLFTDVGSRQVWISEVGEPPTVFATMPEGRTPFHLAIARDGRVFVSDGNGRITVFAADGSLLVLSFAQFPSRVAMDFGPGCAFGRDLWVLRQATGSLHRIDAAGQVSEAGTGFSGLPYDLKFGPDGSLYLSHYGGGRISRVAAADQGCVFADGFER